MPEPLNFVFILVDDMGACDAACCGSTFYSTPHIDRLAATGMRFTDAYAASPVCSPTRASLMTGKNPARLRLTNFLVGKRWPQDSPLVPFEWQTRLPLAEVTIAEALKEAGYATGYVGKWHLGPDPEFSPDRQGFDTNVGGCHQGAPPTYFDPYGIKRLPDRCPGEYLNDRLTEEAERFLDTHAGGPFFLYFAHYAVHIPLEAKPEHVARYEASAAKVAEAGGPLFGEESGHKVRLVQNHPVYAGMIASLDESVGRILAKLDALGVADHTAVVFFSDNGGLSTAEGRPTSNLPLRAGKGWLYEGGIREPCLVRWPGVTQPGSTSAAIVTSDDFYPTMLEMALLALRPSQHVDGVSFAPVLRGEAETVRTQAFTHYPHYSNQGGRPGSAVRAGGWKLVEHFEDGRTELFNLAEDVGETRDLAADRPDVARDLRDRLRAWRDEVGAQVPERTE